jgi:hypothetical protein
LDGAQVGCTAQAVRVRKGRRKQFFFEKKNQKTFAIDAAHGRGKVRRAAKAVVNVFRFFFSKKK